MAKNDIYTMEEQGVRIEYLNKHYFIDSSLVEERPTFLCIGAYTKPVINKMSVLFPGCKVIIYEAVPKVFEEYNSKKYRALTKFVNKALAEKNGTVKVYTYTNSDANSLFVRRKRLVEENEVEGITLASIFENEKLGKIDYLLMNCEGAEIWAMEEISKGNLDITQICTSNHCDHTKLYSKEKWKELEDKIKEKYDLYEGGKVVEYFLYTKKK